MALLEVRNLQVNFQTSAGTLQAVRGMNFDLNQGKTLGIVGESGSGKSQAVFAIMGLLEHNACATGAVTFEGQQILNLENAKLNKIRANDIAMVFQDPMTSLNPYMRISAQMTEVLIHHRGMSKSDALIESIHMLDALGIHNAKRRIKAYPHEFSGGMRQRITIAMALLCRPKILIADEPTTALDVTVQAQIMALLNQVQREFDMGMIFISHDLSLIANTADDILVMYAGQIVEQCDTRKLFENPAHPYSRGLLNAMVRVDDTRFQLETIPGSPPNMKNLPSGCAFAPRCPLADQACTENQPDLVRKVDDSAHYHRCIKPAESL